MIIDRIENLDSYAVLDSGITKVCEYLMLNDICELPKGKYDIDGDNVFLLIDERFADSLAKPELEAHEKYVDIQYCISGSFSIGYKNISQCLTISKEYDLKNDIVFFADQPDNVIINIPGQFVILFPWDAHLIYPPANSVKKAIFKVKYE